MKIKQFTEAETEAFYDSEDSLYRSFWDEEGSLHWGYFDDLELEFRLNTHTVQSSLTI